MKADIEATCKNRGEPIALAEPLLIGADWSFCGNLTDLAREPAQKSSGFPRSLPRSLADLAPTIFLYDQAPVERLVDRIWNIRANIN